jgi:hypothetical protein
MLRKIFDLLLANRLWVYLAATAMAALWWGFASGLIALGLTWAAMTITRNLLSFDDSFDKLHGVIMGMRNMRTKTNVLTDAFGAVKDAVAGMPFDEEPPNPAVWAKEKTDERLYGASFSHMPGNIWHRPDHDTE